MAPNAPHQSHIEHSQVLLVLEPLGWVVFAIIIFQSFVQRHIPALCRVVVSVVVLSKSSKLLEVLLLEYTLCGIEVTLDMVLLDGLRDNRCSTRYPKLQCDLCGCATALLGNLVHHIALQKGHRLIALLVSRICASQWRVSCNMNAVFLVPFDKFRLL